MNEFGKQGGLFGIVFDLLASVRCPLGMIDLGATVFLGVVRMYVLWSIMTLEKSKKSVF